MEKYRAPLGRHDLVRLFHDDIEEGFQVHLGSDDLAHMEEHPMTTVLAPYGVVLGSSADRSGAKIILGT